MTIILKSDKIATQSIGNIFGVVGPTDFDAILDFSLGIYKVRRGGKLVDVKLADVISTDRSTVGMYRNANGEWAVAPALVPRIHHEEYGSGLLVEPSRRNYLADPFNPATQTVTIPPTSDVICLSVMGPGSAAMSGALSEPLSAEATEGNPQYAIGQAGDVTVTVTGELTFFQLELIPTNSGASAPTTPVPTSIVTRAAENILLSEELTGIMGGEAGSIVVSVLDRADRRYPYRGVTGTLCMQNTTVPQGGYYSRRSSSSSSVTVTGQLIAANTTTVAKNASPVPGFNASNTTVMAFGGHGAQLGVAHNGLWQENNNPAEAPVPNEIRIGGGMQYPSANAPMNSLVQRVILYPRKLSQAEAVSLSSSWL